MFAILRLNCLGNRRRAFSTSASNCRRVMNDGARTARQLGPRRTLEPSDALDVDDVSDVANGGDDVLELPEGGDLGDDVVDPAPIGSPGNGLQQRANRTSRSSTPRMRTPSTGAGRVADGLGFSGVSRSALGASLFKTW